MDRLIDQASKTAVSTTVCVWFQFASLSRWNPPTNRIRHSCWKQIAQLVLLFPRRVVAVVPRPEQYSSKNGRTLSFVEKKKKANFSGGWLRGQASSNQSIGGYCEMWLASAG